MSCAEHLRRNILRMFIILFCSVRKHFYIVYFIFCERYKFCIFMCLQVFVQHDFSSLFKLSITIFGKDVNSFLLISILCVEPLKDRREGLCLKEAVGFGHLHE